MSAVQNKLKQLWQEIRFKAHFILMKFQFSANLPINWIEKWTNEWIIFDEWVSKVKNSIQYFAQYSTLKADNFKRGKQIYFLFVYSNNKYNIKYYYVYYLYYIFISCYNIYISIIVRFKFPQIFLFTSKKLQYYFFFFYATVFAYARLL